MREASRIVVARTTPDVRPSRQQEAVSGRDYVSTHATVDMLTDVTQVSVDVAILAVSTAIHNRELDGVGKVGGHGRKGVGRSYIQH